MTGALLDLEPGLAQPVQDAQAVFRTVLQAMARPGRVQDLPDPVLQAVGRPADREGRPIGAGLAALLPTLLDADTRMRPIGRLASGALRAWLRFHTGAREPAHDDAPVDFTLAAAADLLPTQWQAVPLGSDEWPQHGGTLIVEVEALGDAPEGGAAQGLLLELRGPGIERLQPLRVQGLPLAFWHYRQALQGQFPCGFELLLLCGGRIAALPRSTHIALKD